MSFRIRFLVLLVRSFFGSRLNLLTEYRASYRVWPTEVELSVMENARYSYLLVLERFRLIFSSNMWRVFAKHRWTAVMGAQIYKVKRPLHRWQPFTVFTQPVCWDDKWFYFEQKIESRGKLICSAVVSVIVLGKGRKISTGEVLKAIGLEAQSRPLPAAVEKFIAADSLLEGS